MGLFFPINGVRTWFHLAVAMCTIPLFRCMCFLNGFLHIFATLSCSAPSPPSFYLVRYFQRLLGDPPNAGFLPKYTSWRQQPLTLHSSSLWWQECETAAFWNKKQAWDFRLRYSNTGCRLLAVLQVQPLHPRLSETVAFLPRTLLTDTSYLYSD